MGIFTLPTHVGRYHNFLRLLFHWHHLNLYKSLLVSFLILLLLVVFIYKFENVAVELLLLRRGEPVGQDPKQPCLPLLPLIVETIVLPTSKDYGGGEVPGRLH